MFCGLGLTYALTLLDRRRCAHSVMYMLLASLSVLPAMIYYGFIAEHIPVNYQMLPLAFWCLEAYLVSAGTVVYYDCAVCHQYGNCHHQCGL